MVIGNVSPGRLRDITNLSAHHSTSGNTDGALPHKQADSTSHDAIVDIVPAASTDEPRAFGAGGRTDSWSLPNVDHGMRVTFQVEPALFPHTTWPTSLSVFVSRAKK
jgi:hypothetical protein